MTLEKFIEIYQLLKRLQSHVEGGVCNAELDLVLAKELLKTFPEFRYEGYAYRSLRGEWRNGFNNVSWSEYVTSTWYAYDSIHGGGSRSEMFTYSARVVGFHVGRFVEQFGDAVDFFSKGAYRNAMEECEILVISFDDLTNVTEDVA